MTKQKRINYDVIPCKEKRNVAYCKRKKGVVKKAIELSKLCNLDILIVMFDKEKQKLYEFRSDKQFDIKICNRMLDSDIRWQLNHKMETNEDYKTLYDGSKKFNELKSVSNSKSKSQSCSEGGNSQFTQSKYEKSKVDVNERIHNYIIP